MQTASDLHGRNPVTKWSRQLSELLNPRNISFQTCPWADANNDLTAQDSEIGFAKCTGSLTPSLGQVDPNLKRPHQIEYTAQIQHQLARTTSVSFAYYGRTFSDLYTTVNAAVPPSAYTPVTITNPITNDPLVVYNLAHALMAHLAELRAAGPTAP